MASVSYHVRLRIVLLLRKHARAVNDKCSCYTVADAKILNTIKASL